MRKLKFRVWHQGNKVWLPEQENGGCPILSVGLDGTLRSQYYAEHLTFEEGFIIQQFTGLQDSDGKDLYEGDIVQGFKDSKENFISQVVWHEEDAAFGIQSIVGGGAFLNKQYLNHFEIIGNIFQNADLLK
jgi:uncharacterized phage protein (TIGR01671 family)